MNVPEKTSKNLRHSSALRLGEAARFLGLTRRTLLNAEADGRINFSRSPGGHRYVALSDLRTAPVLTLGRAARHVGRCYETVRRWVCSGKLPVVISKTGARFTSLAAVESLKNLRQSRDVAEPQAPMVGLSDWERFTEGQ